MSQPRLANRHQRDLAEWAASLGFTCRYTGSGHLRFDHPALGGHPVFTPATPRTPGAHKERAKLRTALRRAEQPQ